MGKTQRFCRNHPSRQCFHLFLITRQQILFFLSWANGRGDGRWLPGRKDREVKNKDEETPAVNRTRTDFARSGGDGRDDSR